MEINLEKETCDDGAPRTDGLSIEQLPNEILLTIFRNLRFKQLLNASTVCHHWNELVFFLLQNRVSLKFDLAEFWDDSDKWTPNRIYRKVTSLARYVPKGFDNSWYRPMAQNVKKLGCFFGEAHDGGLLEFLWPFEAVETLEIKMSRLQVGKTLQSFVRCSSGILPSIRHLDVRCGYVRMVDFVAQVAPWLVSLKLKLLPRLMPKFMDCEFPLLESLELKFKYGPRVHTLASAVTKFQSMIRNLRKLNLAVDEEYSLFGLAFGIPSIEDLTLNAYLRYEHPSTILSGISRLTNLRSLRLDLHAAHYVTFTQPLPTVESLTINGRKIIHSDALTTIFPNLKRLSRKYRTLTEYDAKRFVSTWRYTLEDLSVTIDPKAPQVITHFCGLKKLRKISFSFNDFNVSEIRQDNVTAFSAIASLDTVQELHVGCLSGLARAATVQELARFKGTRTILIDDMRIEWMIRQNSI